jgi:hypothetical protein
MTHDEVKAATRLIEKAICEHMPSAAVASGWMSEVDPAPFVRQMCERFPYGARPENLGVTALTEWLKERGVEAGKNFIRAVREEWIKEEMRRYCQANPVRI